MTPSKQTLEWSILVRPDGLLPHGGRFPTFISWSKRSKHPCDLFQTAKGNASQHQQNMSLDKMVVRDSGVLKELQDAAPFISDWSSIPNGLSIQSDGDISLDVLLSSNSSSKRLSAHLNSPLGSVAFEGINL